MIRFVVALRAEAEPLIAYYGMTAKDGVFCAPRAHLVVTGVGKTQAALGVLELRRARTPSGDDLWLNVGIAGHGDRAPGALIVASRVVDDSTGYAFAPPLPAGLAIETSPVRTVEVPESSFSTPAVYDMEASAFFRAALEAAPRDRVHALKVVSDNRATGTRALTKRAVSDLIARHVEAIDAFASLWTPSLETTE